MTKLNETDISNYAKLAGFSGQDASIATAIALAESGGDTKSHNATPPDDSYGLWQINMIGALGPARRKKYNIGKNTDLYDPGENARVAYAIYRDAGNKFTPWSTYTSGKYKTFMGQTEGTDQVAAASNAVKDQFSGISGAINSVGQNLFKGLADVVGIILAVVLIIGAIVILALQSKSGKKILKGAAGKVIP